MSMPTIDPAAWATMSPEARAEAEEELRTLEQMLAQNPLLGYAPHTKQVPFHRSRDPLKALLGGNRSGKTTAGIADDLIQTLPDELVPEHLLPFKKWRPPFFCRLVIPDLTKNLDGVILQKVRDWCPPAALKGGSVDKAWNDKMGVLSFADGSYWQVMSNDQDVGKFGGAALHRIHYDEEPNEAIRRECLMRLIDYDGDELFTMTPLLGLSWMFSEIWEPWEKGELPDTTIVQVDMDENPHLSESAKRRVLAGLSNEEKQARKEGRFVHFAGKIYGEFSEATHVIPDVPSVPKDAVTVLGIDPGIQFMAAVVYCYLRQTVIELPNEAGVLVETPSDELVVFDEIALGDETVERIATEIKLRDVRWSIKPRWRVIDPAARNRSDQTGRSTQQEFARHGVYTILGQNSLDAGINRVKERLQRPGGLKVCASCVVTIDQFKKYRWKSPPRDSEQALRTKPVPKHDHLLDALRYVCMSDPVAPKQLPAESLTREQQLLRQHFAALQQAPADSIPGGPGMLD